LHWIIVAQDVKFETEVLGDVAMFIRVSEKQRLPPWVKCFIFGSHTC